LAHTCRALSVSKDLGFLDDCALPNNYCPSHNDYCPWHIDDRLLRNQDVCGLTSPATCTANCLTFHRNVMHSFLQFHLTPHTHTHTHTQTQNVMPDLVHCLLEETTRLLLGGTCPHGQGCAERPCHLVPWLHTASCAVVTCRTASAVVTTSVRFSHSFKHALCTLGRHQLWSQRP